MTHTHTHTHKHKPACTNTVRCECVFVLAVFSKLRSLYDFELARRVGQQPTLIVVVNSSRIFDLINNFFMYKY